MTKNSYKHPPIIEAIIGIIYKHPHDESKVGKFIKKFKGTYADYQESTDYVFDINLSTVPQNKPKAEAVATPHLVYRFSSKDMTEQLLLNESSFVVSQLAPYCGWNDFINRFIRDWKIWKRYLGFNEIKQVGVRYINRLDIPVPVSEPTIELSEYVNVYPKMPKILDIQSSHAIQAKIPINELKSMLTLNSAVVASPLLNHVSLVIDQDIVKTVELPQSDESLYSFLNEVHTKKNSVFESCITDKARELFNK